MADNIRHSFAMNMEKLTSRKNGYIQHIRKLNAETAYRRECGETVCEGEKLLAEARAANVKVSSVLRSTQNAEGSDCDYVAPPELMEYASPRKSAVGPVFTVRTDFVQRTGLVSNALVAENIQDPGNMGTLIRTARGLGVDVVICVGDCADVNSPKVVRASMGAVFTQSVEFMSLTELSDMLKESGLRLYGAALSERACDIRAADLGMAAVAVGNEGTGLSAELLALCEAELIIPMSEGSESLNVATAAAIVCWEMVRNEHTP